LVSLVQRENTRIFQIFKIVYDADVGVHLANSLGRRSIHQAKTQEVLPPVPPLDYPRELWC
jgi:hypothetical protein